MKVKHWRYIIVYDIVKDKRRSKLARILEGYGERVQYSVFECVLRKKEFETLWEEVEDLVNTSEDSIRAYRLCATCTDWTKTVGQTEIVEIPQVYVA